jgi:hypothetical protein
MDDEVRPGRAEPPLPDDPALERWVAELRTEDAARSRARVGAMRALAAEEATLSGVLVDLLERDAPVLLTLTNGRRHRGQVLVVGPDAVVLRVDRREWLVTRLAAVASVRPVGGDPVHGEGMPTTPAGFGRILAAAARPGEWMRVSVGGEAVGGDVVAVSEEVAVLRLDNGDVTYVNLAAVDEVSLASTG